MANDLVQHATFQPSPRDMLRMLESIANQIKMNSGADTNIYHGNRKVYPPNSKKKLTASQTRAIAEAFGGGNGLIKAVDPKTQTEYFRQQDGVVKADSHDVKFVIDKAIAEQQVSVQQQSEQTAEQLEAKAQVYPGLDGDYVKEAQADQPLPENFGIKNAEGLTSEKVQSVGDMALGLAYRDAENARQELNDIYERASHEGHGYLKNEAYTKKLEGQYRSAVNSVEQRLEELIFQGKYQALGLGERQAEPEPIQATPEAVKSEPESIQPEPEPEVQPEPVVAEAPLQEAINQDTQVQTEPAQEAVDRLEQANQALNEYTQSAQEQGVSLENDPLREQLEINSQAAASEVNNQIDALGTPESALEDAASESIAESIVDEQLLDGAIVDDTPIMPDETMRFEPGTALGLTDAMNAATSEVDRIQDSLVKAIESGCAELEKMQSSLKQMNAKLDGMKQTFENLSARETMPKIKDWSKKVAKDVVGRLQDRAKVDLMKTAKTLESLGQKALNAYGNAISEKSQQMFDTAKIDDAIKYVTSQFGGKVNEGDFTISDNGGVLSVAHKDRGEFYQGGNVKSNFNGNSKDYAMLSKLTKAADTLKAAEAMKATVAATPVQAAAQAVMKEASKSGIKL